MSGTLSEDRVRDILATIKPLAAEYYRLTGKPLGVTGEVAEYVAAEVLGLKLAPARTAGYDAIRERPDGTFDRIQIKARASGATSKTSQRMGVLKRNAECDVVLLVLLDNATLDLRQIWEAPYPAVVTLLEREGSKSRERGALGVSEFKRVAVQVWPVA